MNKKLYKSSKDKKIDGVCGGIAEYFGIDSSIVRIIWAISVFAGGIGILLYIIAAIVLPRDVEGIGAKEYDKEWKDNSNYIGVILIGVGTFFLLRRFLPIFYIKFIWPILLIGLGICLLFRGRGDQ